MLPAQCVKGPAIPRAKSAGWKRASENGKKVVKQIAFDGERFDVMSVRRWRDRILDDDTES